jgi:hypothetical protein
MKNKNNFLKNEMCMINLFGEIEIWKNTKNFLDKKEADIVITNEDEINKYIVEKLST